MHQFAIDHRNGVLLIKFAGPISRESLDALNDQLQAFVASNGTMPMIIDLTDVPSTDLEVSTFVSRGQIHSQMTGKRRVFVADSPLLFGLLRIYGAHQDNTGGSAPVIVNSLAEAFVELSLVDPEFEPLTSKPAANGNL